MTFVITYIKLLLLWNNSISLPHKFYDISYFSNFSLTFSGGEIMDSLLKTIGSIKKNIDLSDTFFGGLFLGALFLVFFNLIGLIFFGLIVLVLDYFIVKKKYSLFIGYLIGIVLAYILSSFTYFLIFAVCTFFLAKFAWKYYSNK